MSWTSSACILFCESGDRAVSGPTVSPRSCTDYLPAQLLSGIMFFSSVHLLCLYSKLTGGAYIWEHSQKARVQEDIFPKVSKANPPARFCLIPAPNPIKHNPVGYWFPQKQSSRWVRAPGGSLGTVGEFSRQCLVHYGPSVNTHWSFIDVWWDGWTIQYVNKVKYCPNHILKVIKNVRSRVIYFFIQWKRCKDSMSKTRAGLKW